ncbi:MAG: serine/threonine protein kinase [Proteobacteria bacterium]|nr:serine/threonine protein kinase [Pseudomonadota bacterium]
MPRPKHAPLKRHTSTASHKGPIDTPDSSYQPYTNDAPDQPAQSELELNSHKSAAAPDLSRFTGNVQLQTPPELQDRYRFVRELGSGAQGKVFLAIRLEDNQKVAIKQLRIDSIKNWKEYTLFHREAEVLSSLDIPGVVKFYEALDCLEAEPPCSYIVQEYIEGMTLKQMLKGGYRFSLNRVYDIVLQLLDILQKLHTHNPPIIHRDIKPSNIILKTSSESDSYTAYLIDFGAVANPQIQSGGSTIAGTFGYMSPEQNIGRPTPQSDTYALAAMIAYMISGVDPAEMQVKDLRLIIDPYVENRPTALVQTLRRMLEPNIDMRLADINQLRQRFTNFKEDRYALEDENYTPFSKDEFQNRLLKVERLCQPQNLELWQNLPDLPQNRPAFPVSLTTHPRFADYPTYNFTPEQPLPFGTALAAGIMIFPFAITFVLTLVNIVQSLAHLAQTHLGLLLFVTFLFSFLLGMEYACITKYQHTLLAHLLSSKKRKDYKNYELPYIQDTTQAIPQECPKHLELFKNGRKTIATITDVEYDSMPAHKAAYYENNLRVETKPSFRVFYKFNPPDDDTEFDLTHSVIIHTDPTNMIRVGDPLPILYTGVCIGEEKTLHVTHSMPYPFPINDLETPYDYLFVIAE